MFVDLLRSFLDGGGAVLILLLLFIGWNVSVAAAATLLPAIIP